MYNFKFDRLNTFQHLFLSKGVTDFQQACAFIKAIPYGRNDNKDNKLCVLEEAKGTCSTKHALLKRLATESREFAVKLQIVIFEMNGKNTPKVADILKAHKLDFIPEAHMYLKINGEVTDVTFPDVDLDISESIMTTATVGADQSTKFKEKFHQDFLRSWLKKNPEIKYTFEEIWAIRENCIAHLSS